MKRRRFMVFAVVLAAIVIAFWFAIPYINRAREPAFPKCPSNMRQLWQAAILYAMDHKDHLPDTLEDVLANEDLTPEVFICPSSNDEKAMGASADQWIPSIRNSMRAGIDDKSVSRHCSYIYVGKGLTRSQLTDKTVLIYEPLANHDNDGMNICFGDGHVEFVASDAARKLIAALPTTQPVTSTKSAP